MAKGLALLEQLQSMPCPLCGQRTLGIDFKAFSGVKLYCSGYDTADEERLCPYEKFDLFTVDDELPVISPPKIDTPKKEA